MGDSPRRLARALVLCLGSGLGVGEAVAQVVPPHGATEVTRVAAASQGAIYGFVLDQDGQPLDGAVVSALGQATAYAVTDRAGQFALQQLPAGPYMVRAHHEGYLGARSSIVDVRPAGRTASSFTLRREGSPAQPRVVAAAAGMTDAAADPAIADGVKDEGEVAWRLRRLKRSVLKDAVTGYDVVGAVDNDDWFLQDSIEFLGRAVEQSARAATSFFADVPFRGEVNLLTTTNFGVDAADIAQVGPASGVAFFQVGAPVGRADWAVKMAANQADLSAWLLAGTYTVREPSRHRYQIGVSYGLQRYVSSTSAPLATLADGSRNVGAVSGDDTFALSRRWTVTYGARYERYDYLEGPGLWSPRAGIAFAPAAGWRLHASAAREHLAPGAEEFLPPASSAQWLPPQRTFAAMTRSGFSAEQVEHYEAGIERDLGGVTLGARTFQQRVEDQLLTVFRSLSPETPQGHYVVGNVGDATLTGWGVSMAHEVLPHIRGTVDYTQAFSVWNSGPVAGDRVLAAWASTAGVGTRARLHDLATSLEAEVPQSATRVVVLYRVSNGFVGDLPGDAPGVGARFDIQVRQALPFLQVLSSQWELLVSVRNLIRDDLMERSLYDELFVVRPPKRLIGGLQVRF